MVKSSLNANLSGDYQNMTTVKNDFNQLDDMIPIIIDHIEVLPNGSNSFVSFTSHYNRFSKKVNFWGIRGSPTRRLTVCSFHVSFRSPLSGELRATEKESLYVVFYASRQYLTTKGLYVVDDVCGLGQNGAKCQVSLFAG
jgi:hypothetical protein